MTDLRYGPVFEPAAAPGVWRYVVVALATAGGPPAALIAGFVALITWSGCFIGCTSDPNHLGGALLGLLAVVLLSTGPVLAWLLFKRWAAVRWAVVGGAVVIAGMMLISAY